MKVIIAGGRHFNDYNLLNEYCTKLIKQFDNVEIVSGRAKGADLLGERFAKENNLKIHKFPADWNTHKRLAGIIRNGEMADFSDGLIAFWDGKSKGTKNMIKLAKERGLKVLVVKYIKPVQEPYKVKKGILFTNREINE